jgi:hypothetical protein
VEDIKRKKNGKRKKNERVNRGPPCHMCVRHVLLTPQRTEDRSSPAGAGIIRRRGAMGRQAQKAHLVQSSKTTRGPWR